MDCEKSIVSPSIKKLADRLNKGDKLALNKFFEQAMEEGTPIVESDSSNNEYHLVTFFWNGDEDTHNVFVFGSFPGWDLSSCQLEQLLDTNLWFKTFRIKERLVTTYQFSINDNFGMNWMERSRHYQRDPFNKKTFVHVGDRENPEHKDEIVSVFEHQMKMQKNIFDNKTELPQGKVQVHRFYSQILRNERRIWVYTPHEYSSQQAPYDLLITFDGRSTMNTLSAPSILDKLITEKTILPCIMIGIDCVDRLKELTYNDDFNSFLTTELIPWIRETYHVTKDPIHTMICGFSLGGLASYFAALHHPEIFGNVLSLSGSVHWAKEGYAGDIPWIEHQFRTINKRPINIYMSAGKIENKPLLKANQSLYKILKQLGYQVHYDEFHGGHDDIWWREQLLNGLINLRKLYLQN